MSDEYPLYPSLAEEGEVEAQELVDRFKEEITKVAEHAIGDLYCDVGTWIESDSWTNFRNKILDGLCDYRNASTYFYDFKKIRKAIFEEYREDIIKDLNQDMVKEIEELESRIEFIQKMRW